jgi:hypothetical protein
LTLESAWSKGARSSRLNCNSGAATCCRLQTQSFTVRLMPFARFANLANGPARKLQAQCHDPLFSFSFTWFRE